MKKLMLALMFSIISCYTVAANAWATPSINDYTADMEAHNGFFTFIMIATAVSFTQDSAHRAAVYFSNQFTVGVRLQRHWSRSWPTRYDPSGQFRY